MTEEEAGAVVRVASGVEKRLSWEEQAQWVAGILRELALARGELAVQLLESSERWNLARGVYDNLDRPAELSSMVSAGIKLAHNCSEPPPAARYDSHQFARFMGRLALHAGSDFDALVRRHAPQGRVWQLPHSPPTT